MYTFKGSHVSMTHDRRRVARQRRLVLVGLVGRLHRLEVARIVLEDDLGARPYMQHGVCACSKPAHGTKLGTSAFGTSAP